MNLPSQPGILRPIPPCGRFITFGLSDGIDPSAGLDHLAATPFDPRTVVGIGLPLLRQIGRSVEGLRAFPSDLQMFPSTQAALWLFLGHPDRGAAFDAGLAFARRLGEAFRVVEEIDGFKYRAGRDLSGYEDGTENPKGKAAIAAALIQGRGAGLDGGSFVATQRWAHDLAAVAAMSDAGRDAAVGRHRKGNKEIPDAPASSHVKRTTQESFDPPAFIVRRSMPWGGVSAHGLYFVAYGESLDRFERQLRRMSGRDDGIVDALASFTRAQTGGYYFCPPLRQGKLDLRAIKTP